MIIAMDGPAGSGKSTVAKLLAQQLGFSYLDTGATYRALTLAALAQGVDISDGVGLAALAAKLHIRIEGAGVFLDGIEVTADIRTPRIDAHISPVVGHPQVRMVMVELQRAIAAGGRYVTDGRDTTTVVFPDAVCKFYIDADSRVRAQRRHAELQKKGIAISFDEVYQSLVARDEADFTRVNGPLKKAADAEYIDTSGLTIDAVVKILEDTCKKVLAHG